MHRWEGEEIVTMLMCMLMLSMSIQAAQPRHTIVVAVMLCISMCRLLLYRCAIQRIRMWLHMLLLLLLWMCGKDGTRVVVAIGVHVCVVVDMCLLMMTVMTEFAGCAVLETSHEA